MAEGKGDLKGFLTWLFIPLVVVCVATLVAFGLTGTGAVTMAIAYLGPLAVIGVAMCYVVFRDSKKRWPNESAFTRFAYVITFKGD